MGGIGAHHGHVYAVQAAAFLFSLLFPASVFALLAGAVKERLHRRNGRPAPEPAQGSALVTSRLATQQD